MLTGWLGKIGWNTVQRDRKLLFDIHTELTLQRTNCLTTLQGQGRKQLDVLERIDGRIQEQNGYLRGYFEAKPQ